MLGSDAWEELVEALRAGHPGGVALVRCVEAGDLAAVPVPALARLLIAMLTEASLAIARSAVPAQTRADLGVVLDRILTGLRPVSTRNWPGRPAPAARSQAVRIGCSLARRPYAQSDHVAPLGQGDSAGDESHRVAEHDDRADPPRDGASGNACPDMIMTA